MKNIRLGLSCLLILSCIITGVHLSTDTCTAATVVKVSSVQVTNLTSNYTFLLENTSFIAKTKILPAKATNKGIRWSSSDTSVATVSTKGIVTAKSGGICEISATAKDGSKKKASFFVKVVTENELLCDGTWSSDYGDFTAGLTFSPSGSYSLSDISVGNPIHYGAYQINNKKRTLTFDGSTDDMVKVNETWSYSFPSTTKMLLTKGTAKKTYIRTSNSPNKNYLCNRQGLLYVNKNKNSVSITGYIGTASTLTIPSVIGGKPVVSVYGLSGNTVIKSVNLPDTVTEISSYAFKDCIKLEKIKMSDNLKSILEGAFSGCSSLETITLPDSLEVLEATIFDGCSSLTEITIPEQVTILFNHTFRNCSRLRALTLPENIQSIEAEALSGCENVTIYGYPDSYAQEYAKINNYNFVSR